MKSVKKSGLIKTFAEANQMYPSLNLVICSYNPLDQLFLRGSGQGGGGRGGRGGGSTIPRYNILILGLILGGFCITFIMCTVHTCCNCSCLARNRKMIETEMEANKF